MGETSRFPTVQLRESNLNDGLPPPPFPEGWYFVASRAELRKRKLIHKTWLGEEIVAWSDDQERVCVADAVCPHLGSFLAPEAGSRVREGRLVCPFHGFEYDATGLCVATPYALPPQSARLRVYPTREFSGMVFGWYGIRGRPPQWQLPEVPQAEPGWSDVQSCTLRFPGHPQETSENSVDLAHLRYVHGYQNVRQVGDVAIDGAYLRSCFNFRTRIFGGPIFDVSVETHLHGLGYSQVEFEERSIGYRSRMWILSTPVDGTSVALTIANQVGGLQRPKGVGLGLRLLPERTRLNLVNWFSLRMQAGYVKEDIVVWRRKQYLPHPRLNRADGEILAYRRYCEQFYEDGGEDRGRMQRRLIARQV